MSHAVFLEPLDVLFLRGNKLFGDPGSFGESLVPPWPSVAAGAIRSRMLVDTKLDWSPARSGQTVDRHPDIGTPDKPGEFTVTAFHLARRHADGRVEVLIQPPADLVVTEDSEGIPHVNALTPTPLPQAGEGLQSSAPFALLPVLAERERSKPADGWWLSESGWCKYLAGEIPVAGELVRSNELWALDHRVGVGLDAASRRAADRRLFSVQAVAMIKRGDRVGTDKPSGRPMPVEYDVGFLASVTGAVPPNNGTLRLGGDGRAAAVHAVDKALPQADYDGIVKAHRCRLVLTAPGIFEDGWLPIGATQTSTGEYRFELHGVKARLVCAAVPRAETVSGWDLAKWRPKTAQRAAPAGSVYWLDELDATPESLRKLAARGLWTDEQYPADMRRAEGFNRLTIAAY